MKLPPRPNATIPLAFALFLSLLASVAVSMPSASAQDDSSPTPTATPSPADAQLAAQFAREGKYEESIGAYLAVIAEETPTQRLSARLALAQVYFDNNQMTAAVRQLDTYLIEAPPSADVRAAQYLMASALANLGNWEEALPLYDAYVQRGGQAAAYARMGRAEALAYLGRTSGASLEADAVLDEPLPDSARTGFILRVAQALEAVSPADALPWYNRLRAASDAAADDALALWHIGLIQHGLGNDSPWVGSAYTIIQQYPETSTALEVVERFDELPPTTAIMDGYQFALVYYYNGQSAKARQAFTNLARSVSPARAYYYLGVLDERAGDIDTAVTEYARAAQLDPKMDLADDALWWQGRLLEQQVRPDEAQAVYQRLVSDYEDSEWAAEARFRLALLDYDLGNAAAAAEAFGAIADRAKDEERQRAQLWQGKALQAADDDAGADAVWQALRTDAPNSYYSLRAAVLLGDASGRLRDSGANETPAPDWPFIETWLSQTTGKDIAQGRSALLFDQHWAQGQELLALGMTRDADAEFSVVLENAGRDPVRLYQLVRAFDSAGLAQFSSRAATRLFDALPDAAAESASPGLWQLAYPIVFPELLREAEDDEKAPDVLLMAVVRQESFFDPLAGSTAGALGLMQIVPATGRDIADQREDRDFDASELFRPAVNLSFGAQYLHDQLDASGDNLYQALAAFNGGPGSAQRWRDASGDDVDRFVAEIDFSQTEAYVRLVAENLARYRWLYQDADVPALPRD